MALVPKTPSELKAAVDSMFRIRAVESPPDENGERTVWHRGSKGADLVTRVDKPGMVVHQELALFDDLLSWDRTVGLRTGHLHSPMSGPGVKPSDVVDWDDGGPARVARLARASGALAGYQGDDRYILHIRKIAVASQAGASWEPDEEQVTNIGRAVTGEHHAPVVPRQSRAGLWIVGAGLLVILAALVLLLLK